MSLFYHDCSRSISVIAFYTILYRFLIISLIMKNYWVCVKSFLWPWLGSNVAIGASIWNRTTAHWRRSIFVDKAELQVCKNSNTSNSEIQIMLSLLIIFCLRRRSNAQEPIFTWIAIRLWCFVWERILSILWNPMSGHLEI